MSGPFPSSRLDGRFISRGDLNNMRRPSAYRVFLTRSSEYHVRGRVCLGVKDRRTGAWTLGHPALRGRIASVGPKGEPQWVGRER